MKRVAITLVSIMCFGLVSFAQNETGFGIKGGLNYNGNGKYFESAEDAYHSPDKNVGYHLGVYYKLGGDVFFKPELVYTATKSDYDDDSFDMKKLDLPALVGVKLIGPLNVFGGPAFQYILDTDYAGLKMGDVENDFTVGLNFGIGVSFDRLGIDLRYERGLSENEVAFVSNNGVSIEPDRIDTRPDQIILSLSLKL